MDSTAQQDYLTTTPAWPSPVPRESGVEPSIETVALSERLAELQQRSRKELRRLFHELPVPSLDEIEGEYRAVLLDQGHWFANLLTRAFVNRGGYWIGKAFQPASETGGYGYNIFRTRRGVRRAFRMHTYLTATNAAPEERFTIEYGETNTGTVGTIHDEVRRVTSGLYLGLGSVHLFGGRMFKRPRKVLFALAGPVADFRQEASEQDVFDADEVFPTIA